MSVSAETFNMISLTVLGNITMFSYVTYVYVSEYINLSKHVCIHNIYVNDMLMLLSSLFSNKLIKDYKVSTYVLCKESNQLYTK